MELSSFPRAGGIPDAEGEYTKICQPQQRRFWARGWESPASFWKRRKEHGFSWSISFDTQAAFNTRDRSKSNLDRPYIWRLSTFRRLICPSVCPLLHFELAAARTAVSSRRNTFTKFSNSGSWLLPAFSIQASSAFSSRLHIASRNDLTSSSPCSMSGLTSKIAGRNFRSSSVRTRNHCGAYGCRLKM